MSSASPPEQPSSRPARIGSKRSNTTDRLGLERDGDRVRLITKGGYNWTDRYQWIVEVARKNRIRQFVIDGEAVVLGVDGIADFDALYSRRMTMRCSFVRSMRRRDFIRFIGGAADFFNMG